MVLGSVTATSTDVQAADAQMTASEQGKHPELSRECDRRKVVLLGFADIEGAVRTGLAEHVERGGDVSTLTSFLGKDQRPLGSVRRVVRTPGKETGLASNASTTPAASAAFRLHLVRGGLHQGDAVLDLPASR
jgi:hypothetical protein